MTPTERRLASGLSAEAIENVTTALAEAGRPLSLTELHAAGAGGIEKLRTIAELLLLRRRVRAINFGSRDSVIVKKYELVGS